MEQNQNISNSELKRMKFRNNIQFAHGDCPSNSELEKVRKIVNKSRVTKTVEGVEIDCIKLKTRDAVAVTKDVFLTNKDLLQNKFFIERRVIAIRNLDSGVFNSLGSPSFAIYLYVLTER